MKLAVIIGSIQIDNGSTRTAAAVAAAAQASLVDCQMVTIDSFTTLFTGEYIHFDTATAGQSRVMHNIANSDALLFVVPTYFKSLPGTLKNFFDIVREKSLYEHKTIGFIASNHKNQDFGARHAELVVQGILEFFETQAVFIPEIGIINPQSIDITVAEHMVQAACELRKSYHPDSPH